MDLSMNAAEDVNISRVGPWKDKDEFTKVYRLIYSDAADHQSRLEACGWLTMWKLRRHTLTPASVLSTLAILEIKLKDDDPATKHLNKNNSNELRALYSSAFTRFLNYMSSIMQNGQLKTMYMTAKNLGIDSFMVDLRHLCAHGQVMPSLDVFRRTADYCLKWLHSFYWTRELETICDATVQDFRLRSTVEFEQKVRELVFGYDATMAALHDRKRFIGDLGGDCDEQTIFQLQECAANIKCSKLTVILTHFTNELGQLAGRESKVRGNGRIFCQTLFGSGQNFIELADKYNKDPTDSARVDDFISLNQNLFRTLAICGLIETAFKSLIDICEDDHELDSRRGGAEFWANHVAGGFILFKEVKRLFKAKKDKNKNASMDFEAINTDVMTKDIRNVYKELGVRCNGVLIFGDTIRRPWTLSFDRNYINDRIGCVNEFTATVLEKCLSLTEPPLSIDQFNHLRNLIVLYVPPGSKRSSENSENSAVVTDKEAVYTVEEHLTNDPLSSGVCASGGGGAAPVVINEQGERTYGVWTKCSDDVNWSAIPLGRLPWE